MRKTLTTAALVLAFCCPAFAGIMHTPAPTAPPASAAQEQSAADGLTETVLSVLESLLALF